VGGASLFLNSSFETLIVQT